MSNPLLDSKVRARIVKELTSTRASRSLSTIELADKLGLHTSTIRFHLDQLVLGHLVTTSYERRGVGRPRKVYAIAPKKPTPAATAPMTERDARAMQLLTGLLTDAFAAHLNNQPLTPEEAGQKWAREHIRPTSTDGGAEPDPIADITAAMTRWGYDVTRTDGATDQRSELRFGHCPFRELAAKNPAIVCGLHRGLIRGALAQFGDDQAEVQLLPFAEGNTCLAHINLSATHSTTDPEPPPTAVEEVP